MPSCLHSRRAKRFTFNAERSTCVVPNLFRLRFNTCFVCIVCIADASVMFTYYWLLIPTHLEVLFTLSFSSVVSMNDFFVTKKLLLVVNNRVRILYVGYLVIETSNRRLVLKNG